MVGKHKSKSNDPHKHTLELQTTSQRIHTILEYQRIYHPVQRKKEINTRRAVKGSTKIIRLGDTAITPDPGWGRLEALVLILDIAKVVTLEPTR